MNPAKCKVGGRTVVASGSVVGHNSENIDIYPFENDGDFCIRFMCEYSDSYETSITDYKDSGGILKIILKKKWSTGNRTSSSSRNPFAIENTKRYYFEYFFETNGKRDRHTSVLFYTITMDEK